MSQLFIHLGGDIIIRSKNIIMVLNCESVEFSPMSQHFLKAEEKRKKKNVISPDFIKSIVVTDDEIYYSPVSSLTINRRTLGKVITDQSLAVENDLEL